MIKILFFDMIPANTATSRYSAIKDLACPFIGF